MKRTWADAMTSIVAMFYESPKSAFRSLLSLREIEQHGLQSIAIVDASVVNEAPGGRLHVDRTIEFRAADEQRLGQIFTAEVLGHRAIGVDDALVAGHFSALGFQVNLLREIAENLPSQGAAVVVLVHEGWFDELRDLITAGSEIERWAPDVEIPACDLLPSDGATH